MGEIGPGRRAKELGAGETWSQSLLRPAGPADVESARKQAFMRAVEVSEALSSAQYYVQPVLAKTPYSLDIRVFTWVAGSQAAPRNLSEPQKSKKTMNEALGKVIQPMHVRAETAKVSAIRNRTALWTKMDIVLTAITATCTAPTRSTLSSWIGSAALRARFTGLDKQLGEIYCAGDLTQYAYCLVKPAGQIDLPAIVNERRTSTASSPRWA